MPASSSSFSCPRATSSTFAVHLLVLPSWTPWSCPLSFWCLLSSNPGQESRHKGNIHREPIAQWSQKCIVSLLLVVMVMKSMRFTRWSFAWPVVVRVMCHRVLCLWWKRRHSTKGQRGMLTLEHFCEPGSVLGHLTKLREMTRLVLSNCFSYHFRMIEISPAR